MSDLYTYRITWSEEDQEYVVSIARVFLPVVARVI